MKIQKMRGKRGAKSGTQVSRNIDRMPSEPIVLETFRESGAWRIFLVQIRGGYKETMGEEEAGEVEKWFRCNWRQNRRQEQLSCMVHKHHQRNYLWEGHW